MRSLVLLLSIQYLPSSHRPAFFFCPASLAHGMGTLYCTFTLKEKGTQLPLTKLKDSTINPSATVLLSPYALLLNKKLCPILPATWQIPHHHLYLFTLLSHSLSSPGMRLSAQEVPGAVTCSWTHCQVDEQWEMGCCTDIIWVAVWWRGTGSPCRHDCTMLHPRESPGSWAAVMIFAVLMAAVKAREKIPLSLPTPQHQALHPLADRLPPREVLLVLFLASTKENFCFVKCCWLEGHENSAHKFYFHFSHCLKWNYCKMLCREC